MDKLTAAQRRFGMNMYVSNATVEAVPDTEGRRLFIDLADGVDWSNLPAKPFIDLGAVREAEASYQRQLDIFQNMPLEMAIERTTRLQLEVLALQRLLDEKDAEIDRLTQPTKWWLMLGWVIIAGTVIGVIAGVYDAIT